MISSSWPFIVYFFQYSNSIFQIYATENKNLKLDYVDFCLRRYDMCSDAFEEADPLKQIGKATKLTFDHRILNKDQWSVVL